DRSAAGAWATRTRGRLRRARPCAGRHRVPGPTAREPTRNSLPPRARRRCRMACRPMHADLERVIALQRLDTAAHDAERRVADAPDREKALDARLEAARTAVAAARQRLADNQNARRAVEKDVAVHQARLSKFRDQLMEVKTNREYQAMQHEIEIA